MINLALSQAMQDSIKKITSNEKYKESNIFNISASFRSNKDAKFSYDAINIQELAITQDFINNIVDLIDITFYISPSELLAILAVEQELTCTLKLSKFDKYTSKSSIAPLFIKQYKVVIKNKQDVLKIFNKNDIIPASEAMRTEAQQSNLFKVTFQLIDETSYLIRKRKVNFIGRDMTIKDAILLIANLMDIKKISLVPVHNQNKYTNLIIPPVMELSNIFLYLQNHRDYGIYEKGLGYYFTDETLYIYPAFETEPTTPICAHIYYIGPNKMEGLDNYSVIESNTVNIIANKTSNVMELSALGIENIGNNFLTQNLNKIIDNNYDIDDSSILDIKKYNTQVIANMATKGIVNKPIQPVFTTSSGTYFGIKSEMARYNRSLISVGWQHANLFTFKPGWAINYHYDNMGSYSTRTGICEQVKYTYTKIGQISENIYSCTANMQLSVSNKQT